MRKNVLISAVMLFLFSSLAVAQEFNMITVNNVYYLLDNATQTAEITGNEIPLTEKTLVIPKTVTKDGKTYTVTRIANNSFGNSFTDITLPESITFIGEKAFSHNSELNKNADNSVTVKFDVTSPQGYKPPTFGANVFVVSEIKTILVPDYSLNDFKAALPELAGKIEPYYIPTPLVTMKTSKNVGETVMIFVNWIGEGDISVNGVKLNYGVNNILVPFSQTIELYPTGMVQLLLLECSNNMLTELYITTCPELKTLLCEKNKLTELFVTNLPGLITLRCRENKLTELDVTNCPELSELKCYKNMLTELDVTKCLELTTLHCDDNRIAKLDISNCTKLSELECFNNRIAELDVRKCPELKTVKAKDQLVTMPKIPIFTGNEIRIKTPIKINGENVLVFENKTRGSVILDNEKDEIFWKGINNSSGEAEGRFIANDFGVENGEFSGIIVQPYGVDFVIASVTIDPNNVNYAISGEIKWTAPPGNVIKFNGVPINNGEKFTIYTTDDSKEVYQLTTSGEGVVVTELNISGNGFNGVRLSNNAQIESMDLSDNNFEKLLAPILLFVDNLKNLNLNNCKLSDLELSRYPILESLDVSNNNLTSLDLSGLGNLSELNAGGQVVDMDEITVSDGTATFTNPFSFNGSPVTNFTGATCVGDDIVISGLTGNSGTATFMFEASNITTSSGELTTRSALAGTPFSGTVTVPWVKSGVANDVVSAPRIAAYPNPTTDVVTVTGIMPGATVKLYTTSGALVASYPAPDETLSVNISHLPRGLYILTAGDGETLKIVKN